jgi:hypothetical protein
MVLLPSDDNNHYNLLTVSKKQNPLMIFIILIMKNVK